jgi:hypothetical protein
MLSWAYSVKLYSLPHHVDTSRRTAAASMRASAAFVSDVSVGIDHLHHEMFPGYSIPLKATSSTTVCSQSDSTSDHVNPCVRGRGGNEFSHSHDGKPHPVGTGLVSGMTSSPTATMASRLHPQRAGVRSRRYASSATLRRATSLIPEAALPAHDRGLSQDTLCFG